MGQVRSKNLISGGIAHLVFRNLDGRQVVQSRSKKPRQTAATKASGSEFRQCSGWARQLRSELSHFLTGLTDSYMYRRLTGRLYNTLLDNTNLPKGQRTPLNTNMQGLEGFEFNTHSPFTDYFTPVIEALLDEQRQVQVNIPPFDPKQDMQFPPQVDHAELLVLVHATKLDESTTPVEYFHTLPIDRLAPPTEATLWNCPPLPEGHLVVVTAKLLYYDPNKFTGRNYYNSKVLNPAMVMFCGR